MKPETQQYHQARDEDKATSSGRQHKAIHVTTSLSSGASCTKPKRLAGSATSARPHFSTYSDLQVVVVCEHGRGVCQASTSL
jgi:hypothetical protein